MENKKFTKGQTLTFSAPDAREPYTEQVRFVRFDTAEGRVIVRFPATKNGLPAGNASVPVSALSA